MSGAIEKLKRLTAMSPLEIAHRAREKGYSQLERIGLCMNNPGAPDGLGFKTYLAGKPAQRFYCGPRESPRFIRKNFPHWIDRAVDEAERLLRHEVQLLHFNPVQLGREINWHRDPITGRTWERLFWTAYNPEKNPGERDSKIVHELNRHQHLPRLAKAYHWTGDERYAAEAVAQLRSWIEQNPPGLGINWQSSLEIGIRTISWLWTLFLLLPSPHFDDASAHRIGDSLFAQLEHVHRYTSQFSSPNTHLIGEAAALFIGGLVFRDRDRSAAWMRRGAAFLVQEADRQILEDGAHGELSACYHCYALDFYMQALTLAEQNHFRLPERVRVKVAGMLNFVMHLTTPIGTIPLLGDDDGGRALAFQRRNYGRFNDALGLGAVLFQRPEFKHQAGEFCEETFWLLGRRGRESFNLLEGAPPAENQAVYTSAGYVIQRSGWGPLASHLVFDVGGLGMLTGGHSHADALSLVLSSRGVELLVDSGTYVYNCAPEWRSYFRSTRAHNTVSIDSRDQAETGGTFRWKTRMSTRTLRDPSLPPEYVEAEQDGYERLPDGITHRRRLLHIPGEYWIVVDDFHESGEKRGGQHAFDFHYHFGADVDPVLARPQRTDAVIWAERAGLFLGIYASEDIASELTGGWISRGYGDRRPARSLRATLTGSAAISAMTFLMPCSASPSIRRLSVDGGSAIACIYHHGPFKDVVVFPSLASVVDVAGFRMQGEFFWLRMEGRVLRRSLAIRGRLLHEKTLQEDAVCAPFAAS
jgi:Heparinase II/III-like protein/Heparinase II/III N-terminus